jgi:2-(1,2-epoxy-1,2-dihydrophenyl)acetyl-CoA isomerase
MTADHIAPEPTAYERKGPVSVITLNRPDRLNALTTALLNSLLARLAEAESDPDAHAILLTGAGKAFCAGQDLNDRDPRKVEWPLDLEAIQQNYFHPVVLAMKNCRKPVIVAVNGVASGAGVSLALSGDLIVAAEDARFNLSFVKVGLSVDAGCGWHLVRALGSTRALALLLTGSSISAAEAEQLGLVWQCVPTAKLANCAMDLAHSLAEGPHLAITLIKQAVSCGQNLPLEQYLVEEARLQGIAGKSEDYREGVLSFFEKRSARFAGHKA